MNGGNIILKGALIFGVLGFVMFIILIVLGIVMSAFGFTCNCYSIFAWSLVGIAIVSGLFFWFGCCCRTPEGEKCKGIEGLKYQMKKKED